MIFDEKMVIKMAITPTVITPTVIARFAAGSFASRGTPGLPNKPDAGDWREEVYRFFYISEKNIWRIWHGDVPTRNLHSEIKIWQTMIEKICPCQISDFEI